MLEHERRLDGTISHGGFGDGEGVEVRTKMGSVKTSGMVMSVLPFGLIVRESSGQTEFYSEDLYLFRSLETEAPTVVANQLDGMSVDQRVHLKLAAMGEAGDPTPSTTGAKPLDPDASDAEYKDKDGDKNKGGDPEKKIKDEPEKKDKKSNVAEPESSIDVEKLPDDIKQAIISANDMDEGQMNGVLSDISSSALKALKRTGIDEREIFGLVQRINDASYSVLTGKKPVKKEG